MKHLQVDRDGPVARIWLNRPEIGNALNEPLMREIQEAFAGLGPDNTLRAVVLAGRGDVFSAGTDPERNRQLVSLSEKEHRGQALLLSRVLKTVDEFPCPVIGRVHGAAMNLGMGLVAACDIAIASQDTRFAFSQVKLGIPPAVVAPFVLAKVRAGDARRYFLTAEVFPAAEALRIGLVHRVTEVGKLDAAVLDVANAVLNNGPEAVAAAKALIRSLGDMKRDEALAHTVAALARARTSPEGKEGLKAILEKRPPSWTRA
ncbi:MAG: enoyl-CoA hydratase-related protein [Planctomycetota bacterium]|jgi:methylglutaconyl-CoA hydratase